ncbi:hypothetical protein TNIN_72141 [Trichonephila inaurata madagascariensis]|uniref:Uncharacterized protein n=1 Tax=Trichonephila inaurata madagascariensis TaxID=2747483 RepID=A0A8X6XIZ7_9ARAC|nr:hypothetical protein TNIN_72141 [Trichonephila inaurata madagascariensis]
MRQFIIRKLLQLLPNGKRALFHQANASIYGLRQDLETLVWDESKDFLFSDSFLVELTVCYVLSVCGLAIGELGGGNKWVARVTTLMALWVSVISIHHHI